jgi:hypothetical protein
MARQRYPRLRAELIEGQPVMSDEELRKMEDAAKGDDGVGELDPLDIEKDSNPSPPPDAPCHSDSEKSIESKQENSLASIVPKATPTRKQIEKMTIDDLSRSVFSIVTRIREQAEQQLPINQGDVIAFKILNEQLLTLKWQKEYEEVIPHDPAMLLPPGHGQGSLLQKLKNQKQNLIKAHHKDGRKSSTPPRADGTNGPPTFSR